MENKTINLQLRRKIINFRLNFFLRSIPNKFDYIDSQDVFLKGHVHDFSVDYNAIDKSSIINIQK